MLENCIHYQRLKSVYQAAVHFADFNDFHAHSESVNWYIWSTDAFKTENFKELKEKNLSKPDHLISI